MEPCDAAHAIRAAKGSLDPTAPIVADRYLGNMLQVVERFLFFQKLMNPDATVLPLAQRFLRQDVKNFVVDLQLGEIVVTDRDIEPTTIESYLDRLLAVVRRLDPHGNYKWLKRLARNHRPERRPPASSPLNLEQILEIGIDAMDEARRAIEDANVRRRGPGTHLCVLYRDGLLLVFLALIGLRIGESLTLRREHKPANQGQSAHLHHRSCCRRNQDAGR